uniref:Nudix hydrolase domain-containing protein n=1 Tax=Dunaliella tertiolecta TaxID=3047 RepID=A0A7S3VTM7_DUNTE|mmetsp:Transcript_24836/g.67654  ORF Transcript_24836/g.67654 Transcript_24836/m.67654 type:complete len:311 (-) Transcript_24836:753-1685(-)
MHRCLRASLNHTFVRSHWHRKLVPRGAIRGKASNAANTVPQPELMLEYANDAYGGVIVDTKGLPSDVHHFKAALRDSLQAWQQDGKRGIWLKVPLLLATHVPPAVELGFRPHHAEPEYIMLVNWVGSGVSTIPPNASHQVGIGACVINEHRQILMVQEKNGPLKGKGVWKIPTGLVDAGEDIHTAAEREVQEETGIRTTFDSVLAVRQAHGFGAGKSDLFVMVGLIPEPGQSKVTPCESELEACKWMPLEEYADQPFQRGVALYDKIRERCIAYADGRYRGWKAEKLEGRGFDRSRQDLLLYGDIDQAKL